MIASLLGHFRQVKGPSGTRAADRPFFQWMDLEPNTAVWFQRFGTMVSQGGLGKQSAYHKLISGRHPVYRPKLDLALGIIHLIIHLDILMAMTILNLPTLARPT